MCAKEKLQGWKLRTGPKKNEKTKKNEIFQCDLAKIYGTQFL